MMVMSDIWEGVGVDRRMEGGDCRAYRESQYRYRILEGILTNDSKPCGACMTELGCSSSSERGCRASLPAFSVSI